MWIPSLYPNKDKLILDINVEADPSEENLPAILSPLDQRQFKLPVKSIGLKSDEYLFAIKGKIRPAILLTEGVTGWPTLPTEPISLCMPLYTVDKARISQSFVVQTQSFQIPSKFYIPSASLYHIEESVARFELIQPIHHYAMRAKVGGRNVMLTNDFFSILMLQLTEYWGGVISAEDKSFLKEYGDIILDEARKQGVKIP